MSKILFQINYDVHSDKRNEYLSAVSELKDYLKSAKNQDYMVVEDMNKQNNFTEIYVCENEEQFEAIDDGSDDKVFEITTNILKNYVMNGKTKYSTSKEV